MNKKQRLKCQLQNWVYCRNSIRCISLGNMANLVKFTVKSRLMSLWEPPLHKAESDWSATILASVVYLSVCMLHTVTMPCFGSKQSRLLFIEKCNHNRPVVLKWCHTYLSKCAHAHILSFWLIHSLCLPSPGTDIHSLYPPCYPCVSDSRRENKHTPSLQRAAVRGRRHAALLTDCLPVADCPALGQRLYY